MADTETKEILHPRENNKTNRARREREQKQIKMLRTAGIICGALVVVALIAGLIFSAATKNKTLATVGDEKITVTQYQQAVRAQRANMIQQYQYMAQLYSAFGLQMDEGTKTQYAVQLSEDYKGLLGTSVLSNMVDNRVLAYGAEKEGITVSDEELNKDLEEMFGYYPDGTPTAGPTSIPFEATPTVSQEQLDILRYTPTPDPEAVEEAEEAVEETAEDTVEEAVEEAVETVEEAAEEVVETAEEAVETVEETAEETDEELEAAVADAVEDTIAAVEEAVSEPTPTIAPTEYTEEMYKLNQDYYFANNLYMNREFFTEQRRYEMLREKVEETLSADLPREAEMVWARHILVETEEEANDVLKRLEDGEEWGDIAAEVSLDTANSAQAGDLGWFAKGVMVPEFEEAAFATEVGKVSEPVQTSFGYHLIQVIAHEEHPFTSSEYQDSVDMKYREWLDKYADEIGVHQEGDVTKYTPVEPAFNY